MNGQRVEIIQGTKTDIKDMLDYGKARNRKWGMKLFFIAPGRHVNGKQVMDAEYVKNVAWPRLAAEFAIPPEEAVIIGHFPVRPEDLEHDHFHIAAYFDNPLTGASRNWSWDYARVEKFSRSMEALNNLKVLVGNFNNSGVKFLRAEGEDELADTIESANAPGAPPASRTPPRQAEQAAKAEGLNLRAIGTAYKVSTVSEDKDVNLKNFRKALDELNLGLSLAVSYHKPDHPVWALYNKTGRFVCTLGGCLARV